MGRREKRGAGSLKKKTTEEGAWGGGGALARLGGSRHHLSLVPGTGGESPHCGEAED